MKHSIFECYQIPGVLGFFIFIFIYLFAFIYLFIVTYIDLTSKISIGEEFREANRLLLNGINICLIL